MMRGPIVVYGAENILFVVLTGMGPDGKAVARDCHAIPPIANIPSFIAQAAGGK